MDFYKIDDYFEAHFNTQRMDTGVATDADALPTFSVYEENNETAVASGNCAKRDDGNTVGYYYARAQCTSAAGFEVGRTYFVRVSATVNSVAGSDVVGKFKVIPAIVWNALYGGTDNLDVSTVEIAANVITSASINDGAITNAKVADDVDVNVKTITTDAITASSIKADAVTEIQAGLAKTTEITALDTVVDTVKADTAAILLDTGTDGVVVATASKTGYSLAADQSAVTIGTVNTIASGGLDAIPTETGSAGTLDDTLSGMARALRVRVNDLDAGNYTSEEMYDWINLAYRETVVASKCHKQRVEISLADGNHTYDCGDIFEPISVMVGGKVIDKNTIKGLGINLKTWDGATKGTPTDWIHLTGSFIRYYPTPGATPGKTYVYGFAMPDVLTVPTEVAVAVPVAFRMSAILDRAEAEARKSRSTTANNTALYGTLMESWHGWCVKIADSVRSEG